MPAEQTRASEQGIGRRAMSNLADIAAVSPPAERVLVVAGASAEPLCLELIRRGASVSATEDIGRAAQALRRSAFDVVIVAARADADATTLLIGLARAAGPAKANVMLLIDPADAARYGSAIFAADEILAASMPPRRIADATGVGQRA
jgi:hypothetical protein